MKSNIDVIKINIVFSLRKRSNLGLKLKSEDLNKSHANIYTKIVK